MSSIDGSSMVGSLDDSLGDSAADALAGARILHLFANYKWTGPADPAIRTAARLRELGLDVVFAQAEFMHHGGEHRMAEQLFDWRLPVLSGLQLRKHFHVPSLMRDMKRLRARIQRERFDIVHCHLPADHLMAALACRRLSHPPRLVRSLYEPEAPSPGWRERYCFRRTAGVIVPTAASREGVCAQFGCAAENVLHLDPVTEPRRTDGADLRARWGLDSSHRIVGITARIQPHRRFDLLWDTARAVVDSVPNARFVLLGRGNDADTKELVTDPIASLGLQRHVVLPGYQRGADYHAALRSLDAFLFLVPGSDGTCRAVADAMAFGVPVIATDRGILPSLLAERRVGEPPGRVCRERAERLAAALVELLTDDGLRRRSGDAALRIARTEMDPVRAARAIAGLYRRVLDRGGSGRAQADGA